MDRGDFNGPRGRGHRRGGGGRGSFSGRSANRSSSGTTSYSNTNSQQSHIIQLLRPSNNHQLQGDLEGAQLVSRSPAPRGFTHPNFQRGNLSSSSHDLQRKSPSDMIARSRSINSPGQGGTPLPNTRGSPRGGYHGQLSSGRPQIRPREQPWAYYQEAKIQFSGLSHKHGTKVVYESLCGFGNIVRIDVTSYETGSSAYVTFQPPPNVDLVEKGIKIGSVGTTAKLIIPKFYTIPSPVNPQKKYNEINIFFADKIDFGVNVADTTMISMCTIPSEGHIRHVNADDQIQIMSNLRRKELEIQFVHTYDQTRKFRFRLPFSLLGQIYKFRDMATGKVNLVIPFNKPPQFFRRLSKKDILNTFKPKESLWLDHHAWHRITDIVTLATQTRLDKEPVMNHKDALIDIGRWTTYCLSFDPSTLEGAKFKEFSDSLSDYGVTITELPKYTIKPRVDSPIWNLIQEEISATHPDLAPLVQGSQFHELFTSQIALPFVMRYQLEVCLSNGILKEQNITHDFLDKLVSMGEEQATYILEKVADRQKAYYDPMDIFETRVKGQFTKKVPAYCILSRSVNITPTMLHVSTPVVETSNRIIRKHIADADRFIRVKFTDEKTEGRIMSQDDDRSEALFDRIRRAMNNGIVVAGRYYDFLAFGNSQFREHGAYFYAPTASKTADQIRLAMGQFGHIRTVAKFGARLGQCFSTTRAIQSTTVKIEMIGDVERNGYTFTDGVGKISPFLAQMAAKELGLQNAFHDPPSLFQFRLGGCKGVLALDSSIMGQTVGIRPSQYKFEAQNVGLEIIRASALATACFNRQLISVLSTLGVNDLTFITKQQETVNYLERATKEESVALERLQRNIDFNQITLVMAAMILDGFMSAKDPFVMSLLELWRAYHIKFLKEKARIPIEEGAFVLGCVDETATLRGHYDDPQSSPYATREEKLSTLPEIFLQISDTKRKGHYKVIEGVCLVARNPSLHPGDIRVVRAKNIPALHHMKDVVVFPQTGDRDIANMCSGGDLDGDDYIVIWDPIFIPETINEIPMDFTPEPAVEKEGPITVQDITEFFVTYMKNDSLARIALAHLAQSDFLADGVRDPVCLELANLHSQAVDYPKSGIPAAMTRDLRPKKWPHFMESKFRRHDQTYKSTKILGMLYDQVKLVDFKPKYENKFDERILNAFELDETILQKAADMKISYDSAMKRLMAKHAIQTEFEAWSVFVLSHNQESRDYTFAEEFGRTMAILKSQFQHDCVTAAGAKTAIDSVQLPKFVAAMYKVTAREMEVALEECRTVKVVGGTEVPMRKMDPEHMPLISFPWLFVDQLGKIATGEQKERIATVQQGIHSHKKRPAPEFPLEPGMGDVETDAGVTHFGDLLKLDFGPKNLASSKPDGAGSRGWGRRVTAEEEAEKVAKDDGAGRGYNVELDLSKMGGSAMGQLNHLS